MAAEHDITIIGGGIDWSAHLTEEVSEAIAEARIVLHATCHPGVLKRIIALAEKADVLNIDSGHYEIGQYRPDMYRSMATTVVDHALAGGGVVLIEPGSALVLDLVTQFTLEAAEHAGLRVKILPGISCVELLMTEFGLDPSMGLVVVAAQALVATRMTLNPTVNTIVLQPGYFDTWFFLGWPRSGPARFDELAATLLKSFSSEAPMALVRFPMRPGDVTHRLWVRLGSLYEAKQLLTPLHTLFIPASMDAAIDQDFQERTHSWERSMESIETDSVGQAAQYRDGDSNSALLAVHRQLSASLLEQSRRLEERWQKRRLTQSRRRLGWPGRQATPINWCNQRWGRVQTPLLDVFGGRG